METALYIGTAIVTVLWSVWIYLSWQERARLREDSGFRVLLIVAPSSYFLLVSLSGWATISDFRVDLAALVVLDAITVGCGLVLGILILLTKVDQRGAYVALLVIYNAAALMTVAATFVIRHHPPLIARLASIVGQWGKLDFFSFTWLGAGQGGGQPDLVGMLNKMLIALLSYIPIAVVRSVGSARQRRRLLREVASLRARVDSLEQRVSGRQIEV